MIATVQRVWIRILREVPWLVALLLVAWVDYITGPLVAVAPFYFCVLVPLALRRAARIAVTYALLATAIFVVVDLLSNPGLVQTFYPYWRGFSTLVSFTLVTATIPALVRERDRLMRSERELVRQRGELEELNAKLVSTLEELGAARERAIEGLLQRHTEELEQFKRLLAPVLAALAGDRTVAERVARQAPSVSYPKA
jgi:hypothetical protein